MRNVHLRTLRAKVCDEGRENIRAMDPLVEMLAVLVAFFGPTALKIRHF